MLKSSFSRLVMAWVLVGTLDILAAFIEFYIMRHTNPLVIFVGIASGIFGRAAFTGGPTMMVWGLIFHYLIALAFTAFFFWISPRIPSFRRRWILAGIGYGIFIWIIMRLIVLPLSRVHLLGFRPGMELIAAAILIVCIGIPLALTTPKVSGDATGHLSKDYTSLPGGSGG